jgi:VWFA-related protein
MRHGLAPAAVALAGVIGLAWSAASQPAQVVSIEVAVTTSTGSMVAGLTASDFEVLVDGKPVPIHALAAPPVPLTLVALFDCTASMSTYRDLDAEIERSLAPSLRETDRARIGGIASRLALSPRFTSVRKELIEGGRKALDFPRAEMYGPSPIWDAVIEAVRALESEPGRRGLLLVTDGRATGNTVAGADAIRSAIAAGVVVQVLSEARTNYYRQDTDSVARVRTGLRLEELTRQTGGMILPEDDKPTAQLPTAGPAIARLVNDLREMYTIGIAQAGPAGSAHRVAVKVKREGLSVRARSGYRSR